MKQIESTRNPKALTTMGDGICVWFAPCDMPQAQRQHIANEWLTMPRWYDFQEESLQMEDTCEAARDVIRQIVRLIPDGGVAILYGVLSPVFRQALGIDSQRDRIKSERLPSEIVQRSILAYAADLAAEDLPNALDECKWLALGFYHFLAGK